MLFYRKERLGTSAEFARPVEADLCPFGGKSTNKRAKCKRKVRFSFHFREKVLLKKGLIAQAKAKKEKNKLQGNGVKESTEIRKQGIIHY